MTFSRTCLPLLLPMLLAGSLQAADPASPIEVTPRVKSTTSWDGAPLRYPEGQAEITGLEIARVLVFYAGAAGQTLSQKQAAPPLP